MMHILFDLDNIRENYQSYLILEKDKPKPLMQLYHCVDQSQEHDNEVWLKENMNRFFVPLCSRLSAAILSTMKPLESIHDSIAKETPINFRITGFHTAADVVYYANCILEHVNYCLFGYITKIEELREFENSLTYAQRVERYTESIRRINNSRFYGANAENDATDFYTINFWFEQFEKLYNQVFPISLELSTYVDNPHLAANQSTSLDQFLNLFRNTQ